MRLFGLRMPSFAWVSFEHLSAGVWHFQRQSTYVFHYFLYIIIIIPRFARNMLEKTAKTARRVLARDTKEGRTNFSFARLLRDRALCCIDNNALGLSCRAYVNIFEIFYSDRVDLICLRTAQPTNRPNVCSIFSRISVDVFSPRSNSKRNSWLW